MKTPTTDKVTNWQPVDRQARLTVRPAFEHEKLAALENAPAPSRRAALILNGEHHFMQSGDRFGRVIFLGITMKGLAFSRCNCGRFDTFDLKWFLKALKRANPSTKSICCAECQAVQKPIKQ